MHNTEVIYRKDIVPRLAQIIDLYKASGLPRPIQDRERIQQMYAHSNLVITAWLGDKLVGVARSLTDFRWSCYLADLAVDPACQKGGIGKRLIQLTKETVGNESTVLLLSVPTGLTYYPKVGMEKVENGFIIHRGE